MTCACSQARHVSMCCRTAVQMNKAHGIFKNRHCIDGRHTSTKVRPTLNVQQQLFEHHIALTRQRHLAVMLLLHTLLHDAEQHTDHPPQCRHHMSRAASMLKSPTYSTIIEPIILRCKAKLPNNTQQPNITCHQILGPTQSGSAGHCDIKMDDQ